MIIFILTYLLYVYLSIKYFYFNVSIKFQFQYFDLLFQVNIQL